VASTKFMDYTNPNDNIPSEVPISAPVQEPAPIQTASAPIYDTPPAKNKGCFGLVWAR